ncbi:MAG: lipocalin family protein [Clostridia bacterium]|nr:lipocalin family protein [Clostridia bacterium]
MKKRLCAMLSVVALCFSLAGCQNNSASQPDGEAQPVATEQPANPLAETKEGMVGTWVVERYEIYEGPLKDMAEQATKMGYPVGSEHIFTEDGYFENTALKMTTTYEVINDHQISCVTMIGDTVEEIYDYELNGDELVLYGNYTGDFASYGHCNAMYFKRK